MRVPGLASPMVGKDMSNLKGMLIVSATPSLINENLSPMLLLVFCIYKLHVTRHSTLRLPRIGFLSFAMFCFVTSKEVMEFGQNLVRKICAHSLNLCKI